MPRILLIDDEPTLRLTFKQALSDAGHEVTVAGDGIEGLALFDLVQPHVVVTDLMLPHKDGFSVIKTLRQRYPALLIIGVSGSPQATVQQLCLAAGADVFLPKPVGIRVLLDALENLLERE